MARNVVAGKLLVLIGADPKALEEGLKNAQKSVRKFSRSFTSIGKDLTLSISAPLAGIGLVAVKSAADLEKARVGMTQLTGSGEAAARMLSQIRDYAASTPFRFEGLAVAARNMLAFQFESSQVVPALKIIGDSVGAIGGGSEEFERLIRALGQMGAKGKIAAQEINQIADIGLPIRAVLADALGVTTRQLEKLQEKGIDAETGIKAILTGFDQLFRGSAERLSQTVSGLFSTLVDNIQIGLSEIGADIIRTFQLREAMQGLTSAIKYATAAWRGLPPSVKSVIVVAAALLASIGPLIFTLGQLAIMVGALIHLGILLAPVLGAITIGAAALAATIGAAAVGFGVLVIESGGVVAALQKIGLSILGVVVVAIEEFLELILELGGKYIPYIGEALEDVADRFRGFESDIRYSINQIDAEAEESAEKWKALGAAAAQAGQDAKSALAGNVLKSSGTTEDEGVFAPGLDATALNAMGELEEALRVINNELAIFGDRGRAADGVAQALAAALEEIATAQNINGAFESEKIREWTAALQEADIAARSQGISEAFADLAEKQIAMGAGFDIVAERSQLARSAIQELLEAGVSPLDERIRMLSEALQENMSKWEQWALEVVDIGVEVSNALFDAFQNLIQGMADAVAQAIVYQKDFGKAALSVLRQIGAQLISTLIQLAIEVVKQAIITGTAATGQASTVVGARATETYASVFAGWSSIPFVGPALGKAAATAAVATMLAGATAAGAAGRAIGFTAAAEGAVVTGPTLALIGEGRESEFVAPLSALDRMVGNRQTVLNHTTELEGRVIAEEVVRFMPDALATQGVY